MATNSRKTGRDLEGCGRGVKVISRRGVKITTKSVEIADVPAENLQDASLGRHPYDNPVRILLCVHILNSSGGPPIHPVVTDNPFPKVKSAR